MTSGAPKCVCHSSRSISRGPNLYTASNNWEEKKARMRWVSCRLVASKTRLCLHMRPDNSRNVFSRWEDSCFGRTISSNTRAIRHSATPLKVSNFYKSFRGTCHTVFRYFSTLWQKFVRGEAEPELSSKAWQWKTSEIGVFQGWL